MDDEVSTARCFERMGYWRGVAKNAREIGTPLGDRIAKEADARLALWRERLKHAAAAGPEAA